MASGLVGRGWGRRRRGMWHVAGVWQSCQEGNFPLGRRHRISTAAVQKSREASLLPVRWSSLLPATSAAAWYVACGWAACGWRSCLEGNLPLGRRHRISMAAVLKSREASLLPVRWSSLLPATSGAPPAQPLWYCTEPNASAELGTAKMRRSRGWRPVLYFRPSLAEGTGCRYRRRKGVTETSTSHIT